MSTAAVPAQSAPPAAPPAASGLANDQAGKRASGDSSIFSNLLEELTTNKTSPAIQRGKGGNQKPDAADEDARAKDDLAQTSDQKSQQNFDAAAAIAAIIAPSQSAPAASASTLDAQLNKPAASAMESGLAAPSDASASNASASAVKALAAQLDKQAIETGPAMPSDTATATLPDAAPSVTAVHVEQARTFLGVDNVTQATRAKVDGPALAQSEAKAANAVAPADGEPKPNLHHPGGGTSSFAAHDDDAASARQDRRDATGEGLSIEGSALSTNVQVAAANSMGTTSIDQLPDVIADQAQALASQGAAATGNAGSANPVKELDVRLNPSDLGSLSVKMRIANGNLTVVIETEKSSTAKMIESERDSILARLGSADQPIASIVIKASDNASMQGGNNNAPGSATPQHADAQNGSGSGSRAQTRRGREDQSEAGRTDRVDNDASIRARTGDLFV